ncbi:MAG: DegV family protein [Tenericutes bacterium]|nr:DegV family protein [Mycoplasmatota bacterium]
MKIGVITDSGSNLSLEYFESIPNLKLAPLQINIDEVYFRDVVEKSADEVYEELKTKHISTSLPKIEDYLEAVEYFKAEGYTDILTITISSGLSGTYNAFRNANLEVEGINMHLHDTKTLGMAEGYIVKEALKQIKKGTAIQEIMEILDDLRFNKSVSFFTVETLKYLRRGGRIGFVEGTIGDILHVKPIISVNDDGLYYTISKGFGMKRTYITMKKKLMEFAGDDEIELTIHYGIDIEQAKELERKVENDLNVKRIDLVAITPVLGIHTGPNIVAVCARKV